MPCRINSWIRIKKDAAPRSTPDYIIRFKDGSIGIYDTKAGFTADNEHVRQKAEQPVYSSMLI